MTLIIQDDTGLVAGANSYATVAEFIAYWADRGITYSDTELIEASLIKGWEYTDTAFDYCGCRLNGRAQTTQFPRTGLKDEEGNLVTDIPYEMKNAQMEYAQREIEGVTLQQDANPLGSIKSERKKVDVIEKETVYTGSGGIGGQVAYPTADNKIPKSFICEGSDGYYVVA
jgi:hypothetical protein